MKCQRIHQLVVQQRIYHQSCTLERNSLELLVLLIIVLDNHDQKDQQDKKARRAVNKIVDVVLNNPLSPMHLWSL